MALPVRLLYVDDEPALLEIGKIFLEKDGDFSVTTIDSAPAALALLRIEGFDTIISDYQMPEMDGIAFLKQLKASGNTTPFIIFTGRGREEIVIQALNEGADFYLQKGGEPRSQFAELAHKIRLAVEQRRAVASIRDHERREADIINFLPDATFAIDTQGSVIAWNRAMEKMTGVTSDQILGKGNYEYSIPFYHERRPILIDLVLKDDPVTSKKYPDILRDGTTLFSEITIPHFNNGRGAALWFTASPLYNTLGRIVGAIESIREITARKKIEEALAESERQFREFSDLLPQIVYETDTRGNIKYANHIAFELFGYSDAEVGLNVIQMLAPAERERAAAGLRAMVEGKGKTVAVHEYNGLRKNGSTFPLSIYLSPVLVNNQITGIRGIIIDNTENKLQDRILQNQRDLSIELQSARGLHDTLETCLNGAIGISGMDAGGIYLVNGKSGSLDLIVSRNLGPEFIKSASHYPDSSEQARIVMTGEPVYIPYPMTGTDHHSSWEQEGLRAAAIVPVHYNRRVVACLNICSHSVEDVPAYARVALETVASQIGAAIERNRADEALIESEQRYRNVVEDQTELISRFLPDGTHIFVNEAYCRYFSLKRDEILGHRFRPDIPEPDKDRMRQFFTSLTPDHPVDIIEHRIIMQDGSIRWQRWSDRALFDNAGTITEYQSVGRDITVQKQAEEELRHQNDAIEASIDGMAILNENQVFTYMNRAHARIYGYDSPADLIGKSWKVLYDASELERFNREIMPEFSRNGQFRGRARGLKKDTSTFPQEISLTSLSSGGLICVVRDITKRTQVEDALKESEERFRLLVENLQDPVIILGFDASMQYANNAALQLAGIPPTPDANNLSIAPFIARESQEKAMADLETIRIHGGPVVAEYRMQTVNGEMKWVEAVGVRVPWRGADRDLVSLREITWRKQAEQELSQQNESLGVINQLAIEFASLPRGKSVAELATKKLLEFPGVVVTTFSRYNSTEQTLQQTHCEIAPDYPEKTIFMHKKPSCDIKIPVSAGLYKEIVSTIAGRITTSPGSGIGQIPPFFNTGIQKQLGIDHFMGIGYVIEGELYGTSLLAIQHKKSDPPTEILESFAHIVAVSLRRDSAEATLHENEEKVALVMDGVPALLAYVDADMRYVYVNKAYADWYGLTKEEIIGKQIRDLLTEEVYERSLPNYQKVLGGTPVFFENRTVDGEGKERFVSVRLTPSYSGERVTGWFGSIIDITERRRTEEALKESESFNRGLVENLPDYIVVYGQDGKLLYVNPSSALALGYDAGTLVGTHVLTYIAAEYHDTIKTKIAERLTTAEIPPYEIEMITRDERRRSVLVKGSPIRFQNEPAVLLLLIDITERKKAEDALLQANQKLKLLSCITRHDINNQILALDGFLELLHGKISEPSTEEYFTRIKGASSRISSMIRFTKEYEKIGAAAPAWQDCHTHVNTAAMQAPLGHVTVINDIPLGAEIFADPLIARVWYNLMDNAARYGGKITTIRFFVQEDNGNRIIVCEDDGDGVPAEEKALIFKRGFGKNTGMGLFLAREILSITGITIRETGEPGKGARFEMVVPKGTWRSSRRDR
ncbi:MAG: PAS domain S-box protein [Methanoregula sp.]|nr:PAS domain S-box protein [Methanoregula sp.]